MSRARDLANGITTLAPLASPDFTGQIDLTGTEALIKLEDSDSSVVGQGFIDFDGFSLQLNTHRDPVTGANNNNKAPASIIMNGNNEDSSISFYTKNSNSGAATKRLGIDKLGSITTPNGEFNGTIGSSAAFPTKVTDHTYFYYLRQPGQTPTNSNIGYYLGTENVETRFQYCSGIAPTNFTSVQDIKCWFICTQTPPNGGTSAPYIPSMDFGWQIGSNGNDYDQHALTLTTVSGYSTDLLDRLNAVSCMNVGSSGSRFEDLIASGDSFGMAIDLNGSFARSALGISITWRF